MAERTIEDWLEKLPAHFVPENAGGMEGDIQLRLSGEGGGDWFVTIQDNQVHYAPGTASKPRVTLTGSAGDVLKVLSGQLDGMRAYMTGKLKISGDTGYAMRLIKVFRA